MTTVPKKKSGFDKFLDGVEKIGNKLPNPTTLFLILAVFVVVLSALLSALHVTAINPADGSTVEVFNLMSADGLRYLWSNVITNFSGFAPLGMVLVAVIGSSVAEKSGFLAALMNRFLGGAKGWVVTAVVVALGIELNIAGDAGNIMLPPLAAILFMSVGRHPLLGMFTAYASVSAGFCANLILGLSDALAYGFTEPAAQMIDPNFSGSIAINWYFLVVSFIILTITGTLVTEKIMLKRFPVTQEQLKGWDYGDKGASISDTEKKALAKAGIAFVIFLAVMLLLSLPLFGNPILADETGSITNSAAPFTKGIVFTVTIALFVPGVVYGFATGKYKNDKDLWDEISKGFAEMGSYVFMCFFISIFTNFFSVTNIGKIIAIGGANGLQAIGFTGIPLMIGLIILALFINIFIGSASAKWAILAPIYVPMMMLLGYHPALTQIVYRIGDSLTNPLTPLNAYMAVLLGFAHKYDKKIGVGNVIANMLPYSLIFAVVWIIQLIIWVVLDLPLGPGGFIYLP